MSWQWLGDVQAPARHARAHVRRDEQSEDSMNNPAQEESNE